MCDVNVMMTWLKAGSEQLAKKVLLLFWMKILYLWWG